MLGLKVKLLAFFTNFSKSVVSALLITFFLAAKSEHHLEDLVAAASTKMSEVDLLDRTKKTRQSYDSMVAQLQWEAAW